MCNDAILFRADGGRVECSNQGELARALGGRTLPILDDYLGVRRALSSNACLCPVDVDQLAAELGWEAQPPEYWIGSDHFDAWALREPAKKDLDEADRRGKRETNRKRKRLVAA